MLKGLALPTDLDAVGIVPGGTGTELPANAPDTSDGSRLANGKSKLDIPYTAERDNFMLCLSSSTGVIGIAADNEKDARRIRTKHYRARGQLHDNGVTMFNNIVVQVEQRAGQWYCTLTYHKAYQVVELPRAGTGGIEASLGIEPD